MFISGSDPLISLIIFNFTVVKTLTKIIYVLFFMLRDFRHFYTATN